MVRKVGLTPSLSQVAEYTPAHRDKDRIERQKLVNLIKLQAREMEALKAEINMLRHKGGHVYTPIVKRQTESAK